jgi:hypothetical protein
MKPKEALNRVRENLATYKVPIAIILAIWVVIILASILAAFAIGHPDPAYPVPHLESKKIAEDRIEIAHRGGDEINISNLVVGAELNGSDDPLIGSDHSEFRTAVYETNLNGVLESGESIEIQDISSKVERISLMWRAENGGTQILARVEL